MRHRPALFALCLLAAAVGVHAQGKTVYKVQLPNGKIEFTDAPPPGAKILETIQPQPNLTLPRPPAPAAAPAGSTPSRASGIDAAMREVEQAERALAEARRARDAGREPREGETIGIKGGGVRTTPAYEARLKALDDAVADAEDRARRAHEARNAAR
jgi:hypothetical protein